MSDVNPELELSTPPSSTAETKNRVTALFGSAPEVILKAVGNFLKQEPGELDHHNLRLIATAAPAVQDPKLVAELIDQLPITKMSIRIQPIEIEKHRPNFAKIMPNYGTKTRQRLVGDLVRSTTLDHLLFSPPERLTPGAREIVAKHLAKLANGSQNKQAEALASPHATSLTVEAVLDAVERRIDKAAAGSEARPPGKLPLQVAAQGLLGALDSRTTAASPANVERAWALLERCEPDPLYVEHALLLATRNPKLTETAAHAVLDAIDHFQPQSDDDGKKQARMRGSMMSVPEMPESAVRRAATSGCEPSIGLTNDLRDVMNVHRGFEHLNVIFGRPSLVDPRWYVARDDYYNNRSGKDNDPSSTPPSPTDLDRRLAMLPERMLTSGVVQKMTDPDALAIVAGKAEKLYIQSITALVKNPHVPIKVPIDSTETSGDGVRRTGDPAPHPLQDELVAHPPPVPATDDLLAQDDLFSRFEWTGDPAPDLGLILLTDPRLNDADLARVARATTDPDRQKAVLDIVVHHPAAGDEVLDHLLELGEPALLDRFSAATPSPAMHSRLENVVNDENARRLASGGRARPDSGGIEAAVLRGLRANGSANTRLVERVGHNDVLPTEEKIVGLFQREMFATSPTSSVAGGSPPGYTPVDVARQVIADATPNDRRIGLLVSASSGQAQSLLDISNRSESNRAEAREAVQMLADRGLLSSDHWSRLTGNPDKHIAELFATHPLCPQTSTKLEPIATEMVSSTAKALTTGSQLPDPVLVKAWSDLPNRDDVPLRLSTAARILDGQTVGGRTVRVIRTLRELRTAADYMGNCLEGYDTSLTEGSSIIGLVGEGADIVAVAWRLDSGFGLDYFVEADEGLEPENAEHPSHVDDVDRPDNDLGRNQEHDNEHPDTRDLALLADDALAELFAGLGFTEARADTPTERLEPQWELDDLDDLDEGGSRYALVDDWFGHEPEGQDGQPGPIEVRPTAISITEVNSRFNQENVPDDVRRDLEAITERLRNGELMPVAEQELVATDEPSVDDLAPTTESGLLEETRVPELSDAATPDAATAQQVTDATSEDPSASGRRARPPARARRLRLEIDTADRDARSPAFSDSPSLLAPKNTERTDGLVDVSAADATEPIALPTTNDQTTTSEGLDHTM